MLIDLDFPFNIKWKRGYLRIGNEGRKIVDLYNTDADRTTISYARYLMGVHLGFEVPPEYDVDHIDDDKTNDSIDNLQILTKEQNRLKQEYRYIMYEQVHYYVQCAYCEFCYLLSERELKMKQAKNLEYIFCSRKCAGSFRAGKTYPKLMPSHL